MLRMIPREPGEITANILYERLKDQGYEISIRSIQRDLIKYSTVFPISCREDTSKTKYWYFLKDSNPFDIPEMSPLSALTFSLAESFLKPMLPAAITRQLDPHFKCAKNFLKKFQSSSWIRWSEKIRIVPRGHQLIPAKIRQEVLDGVFEALWREKQLEASYRKRGEKKYNKYTIHPLGLVFRKEVVYLVCTLWGYSDVKQMALHRFKSAELKEETRKITNDFKLDQYIADEEFHYPVSDEKLNLKLLLDKGAAIHLYETKLSEDQTLKIQDDKVLLEATVKNTSDLQWWILGFGEYAEVLEPEELRNEFKERVKNLGKMYNT